MAVPFSSRLANGSHKLRLNSTPTVTTPTLEQTAAELIKRAIGSRGASFKVALLKQDGYRCVVSDPPDVSHSTLQEVQEVDSAPARTMDSLARGWSFSINGGHYSLRNYASLSANTLQEIAMIIYIQNTYKVVIHDLRRHGLTYDQPAYLGSHIFDNVSRTIEFGSIPSTFRSIRSCQRRSRSEQTKVGVVWVSWL